jgi:hypothetical protein
MVNLPSRRNGAAMGLTVPFLGESPLGGLVLDLESAPVSTSLDTSVYASAFPRGTQRMAHQFSVEIHEFLSKRIEAAEQALAGERLLAGSSKVAYWSGRLDELRHAREQLAGKYDLRFHKYY